MEGDNPAAVAESTERARRAGRGLFVIVGAKSYHIVTGYAIALLLPRMLGSPEVFGLYSKVMAAVAILDNVLGAATIQSVSRFVSRDEAEAPATYRWLLPVQVGVGVLVAGALFACAPLLAAFHRDAAVAPLVRVVAALPLAYSAYAAAAGYLNGRQRFAAQAWLDVAFYTIRGAGILGGAALLGGGAMAPIQGVGVAAVVIVFVSLLAVGSGERGGAPAYREWVAFVAPLWLYHVILNGILELDVQVLAKTVSELALAAGESAARASELANTHVGLYHAAQTFAFVPYQLMLAMTFVVFPMVSRATSAGDEEEARRTIGAAMRASLLALLVVAAPIAGASDGVMRLAYPEAYLAGAPALGVLSIGIVACALFVVAGTILTGAGRPSLAALIAAVGLAVSVAGTTLMVQRVGIGPDTLAAAALGSSAGMTVAFLLAAAAVYARFRTLVAPASVLRGALAAVVGFAVARVVPHATPPGAIGALIAGFGAAVLALVALRELGPSDLRALRGIVERRAAAPPAERD